MNPDKEALNRVLAYAQKEHGVKIKFKNESSFMKVLGWILFFNPRFMTKYTTIIGTTAYFPSRKYLEENPGPPSWVFCHELVHMSDAKQFGSTLFNLSYLFPQCLAIFSLLSFVIGPWALLALLFLLPIPALFRTRWELRGYAMTDAVTLHETGHFTNIGWMSGQFTTGAYYFMWPFEKQLKREIQNNRRLILDNRLHEKIPEANDILKAFSGVDYE